MPHFRFTSAEIFLIFRQGVVFRGIAEAGSVSKGDRVSLLTRSGQMKATVLAIELKRKLIDRSIIGVEIGIALTDFDRESVNAHVRTVVDESDAYEVPSIESVLDVDVPITLEA